MKLPQTIKICGLTYALCQEKNSSIGGWGKTGTQVIEISTGGTDERTFENLVHEAAELICCEKTFRYVSGNDDGDMYFIMTHKEFDDFARDLAMALFPLIEKESKKTKKLSKP